MNGEPHLALRFAHNFDPDRAGFRDARPLVAAVGEGELHERPTGARGAQEWPGAIAILRWLREQKVPHGIATSGRHPEIDSSLAALGVPADMVVVDRGDVLRAKPEPDLFLKCQEEIGVEIRDCYVVGDAVWDLLAARRAGMLSVGMLAGGYGWDELIAAGAFRVYRDTADLHRSLDELGII